MIKPVAEVWKELRKALDMSKAKEYAEEYGISDYRKIHIDIVEEVDDIDPTEMYTNHPNEVLQDLFPFEWEEPTIPKEVVAITNEWEGMYYYTHAILDIPELVPLLDKLDTDLLTISHVNTKGSVNHTLEFVYLPDSGAFSENEIANEFASQPGRFLLAIQDEGYHGYEEYINFYMEVRALGFYICQLIEEHKQAVTETREAVAA